MRGTSLGGLKRGVRHGFSVKKKERKGGRGVDGAGRLLV